MTVPRAVSYTRTGPDVAAGARPIRRDTGTPQPSPTVATGPARMTALHELQLVDIYRLGGPAAQDALAELVRAYQRRIYSICLRMVRHRDDASDLTQEALLKMIEGLGSYNGRSKLSTWVIRVAMNCCLSHLRKQKLRSHESLDTAAATGNTAATGSEFASGRGQGSSMAGIGATLGGREPLPQRRIEQEQIKFTVLQALESLDTDTRAVLVLRDLHDLDYQQLAEVLEIPIGTVKSRLFRARAALRAAVTARGGV